jgi:hypothetical protein
MSMSRLCGAVFVGIITTISSITMASPINQVDYFSLIGTALIDFEGPSGGTDPGTNYDGVIDLNAVKFAERFVGQVLTTSGSSDVLSGSPVGGLSLQVGAPNQNLNIVAYAFDDNVIDGLGPLGFPNSGGIGEGAIAILFDNDQSEFGFRLVGGGSGSAQIEFWKRDGSPIDAITLMNLRTEYFGFSREGGIQDIAGISIWNTDLGGIGFDDIRFNVVPVPPALYLFGSGLLGLIGISRPKNA